METPSYMDMLLGFGHTALSFILILSFIVFIHEFGHYLAARLCGVKIDAFSIGFGKELFGINDRTGTRWKVCIAPLGGYVQMHGDATEASTPDAKKIEEMPEAEKKISFHHKKLWQKGIIVAAGPLFNFLLAIIIFSSLIYTNGLNTTEPIVGEVIENSAGYEAGLQSDDRIISIDGETMKTFNDIPTKIATNLGEAVNIRLLRDGKEIQVTLKPRMDAFEDALGNKGVRPLIGISSKKITSSDVTLPEAVWESVKRTYTMVEMSLAYLGQIITGDRSAKELKGPLGIAELSGKAAKKDFETIIWFMALLSVNLGFVNILPIPPLDGGHLLFYALEGAQGRPMAEKFQAWGYKIGFAFIATLMLFTIFNDIVQLVS
jgi:regulator of sigma E protease